MTYALNVKMKFNLSKQTRLKSFLKVELNSQHPTSKLKTEVLKVLKVEKGQPVGYGAIPSPEAGEIAIIALGYGDGFQCSYQSAHIAKGRVLGRVNMDMAQVFYAGSCPYKKGDEFIVWDHRPETVMSLSDESGNSPYTLFCSLTERIPRTFQTS